MRQTPTRMLGMGESHPSFWPFSFLLMSLLGRPSSVLAELRAKDMVPSVS